MPHALDEAEIATLRADAEVVVVPGNHDHRLLRPWLGESPVVALPVVPCKL